LAWLQHELADERASIGQILRANGYNTAAIGSGILHLFAQGPAGPFLIDGRTRSVRLFLGFSGANRQFDPLLARE